MLLDAALLWHQQTGGWDADDLKYLKRERAAIGQDTFSQLVASKVQPDLHQSLYSGIEAVESP